MIRKEIRVEDLTCPTCVNKIEKALIKRNGVSEVKVLFNASKIKVMYDESVVQEKAFIDIVEGLGYRVLD